MHQATATGREAVVVTDDQEADAYEKIAELDAANHPGLATAAKRDDEWGAKVRVVLAYARCERPSREDCRRIGLQYPSFELEMATPNFDSGDPIETARKQARPVARDVLASLDGEHNE